MKGLVSTGRPESLVEFADVDIPSPGPGEALVEVRAFSVNRGEIFRLEDPSPGAQPGKDIAGVVARAAADGTGPSVGQRVVGHPEHSGWAQYAAVPTVTLAPLPDTITAPQAAALPLAGLTALRLLRAIGPAIGRRILLTGASGGVGHYFTELAASAGAEVTAVTASVDRGRRLTELGAVSVIRDIADAGGRFDTVLESTGGDNLALALGRLETGGTLLWFGQASRIPATLSFFDILGGPQTVTIRSFAYWDSPVPYGQDLEVLVRLVAAGRLHPEIGREADWADTASVLDDLYQRRIRGNAVLRIS
ncbi:MAG TPA: zinc-binding dehydrogenase [Streptosporangiaceae bacterium]|nr:zinc-binding dehydrogenase [Streptosporangiaceae bacterium]